MNRCFILVVSLAFWGATVKAAEEKAVELKVGDKAPEFSGVSDAGKPWKSKDRVGKKFVVVYFYPADMTGGCTAQACQYRDSLAKIEREDVEVVGVSGDSVENHQKFKKEYDLNFALLADEKGEIAKKFGVATMGGGKHNALFKDGNTVELVRGVTTMRWTFVIGLDGTILDKDERVDAAKDALRVLAVIEKHAPTKK